MNEVKPNGDQKSEGQKVAKGESARLILAFTIAGLLSGLTIVSIYQITLPTITANRKQELREAVFNVLPGIAELQALSYEGGKLQTAVDGSDQLIYAGYAGDGRFVGYAIPGEGPGFQDTIKLLYGYQPARELIVGMEILESRETPGLGDKIYKDAKFVDNFKALEVKPSIKSVKKGSKTQPNEVDSITGATISSKAVVRILNASTQVWLQRLPIAGSEPAWRPVETRSEEAE